MASLWPGARSVVRLPGDSVRVVLTGSVPVPVTLDLHPRPVSDRDRLSMEIELRWGPAFVGSGRLDLLLRDVGAAETSPTSQLMVEMDLSAPKVAARAAMATRGLGRQIEDFLEALTRYLGAEAVHEVL